MVPVPGISTSEHDPSSTAHYAPTIVGSSFVQRQSGTSLVHRWPQRSHASSVYSSASYSPPYSHGPSRTPSHSRSVAWPPTAWPATSLCRGNSEHTHAPSVAEDSEPGSVLFTPFFQGMRSDHEAPAGSAGAVSPRPPESPTAPAFHSAPRTVGCAAAPALPTVSLPALSNPASSPSHSHSHVSPLAAIVAGDSHFPPSSRYTRTLGKLDTAVEHGPATRQPTLLTLQSSALPHRYAVPVALTRSSSSPALARGARLPGTILGHRPIKSSGAAQLLPSTSGGSLAPSFVSANESVTQGTQGSTFVTPTASVGHVPQRSTVVTHPTTPRRPLQPLDPEGPGGHGSPTATTDVAHAGTAYPPTKRSGALLVVNAEVQHSSSDQDLQEP